LELLDEHCRQRCFLFSWLFFDAPPQCQFYRHSVVIQCTPMRKYSFKTPFSNAHEDDESFRLESEMFLDNWKTSSLLLSAGSRLG
jgi:hypothetical protein